MDVNHMPRHLAYKHGMNQLQIGTLMAPLKKKENTNKRNTDGTIKKNKLKYTREKHKCPMSEEKGCESIMDVNHMPRHLASKHGMNQLQIGTLMAPLKKKENTNKRNRKKKKKRSTKKKLDS
eukprot:440409_1